MYNYVRLGNGDEYGVAVCGANAEMLFVTLDTEIAVTQAAQAFSNEGAADTVEYYENEVLKATYHGYTKLFGVMNERMMHKTQIYMCRPEG